MFKPGTKVLAKVELGDPGDPDYVPKGGVGIIRKTWYGWEHTPIGYFVDFAVDETGDPWPVNFDEVEAFTSVLRQAGETN